MRLHVCSCGCRMRPCSTKEAPFHVGRVALAAMPRLFFGLLCLLLSVGRPCTALRVHAEPKLHHQPGRASSGSMESTPERLTEPGRASPASLESAPEKLTAPGGTSPATADSTAEQVAEPLLALWQTGVETRRNQLQLHPGTGSHGSASSVRLLAGPWHTWSPFFW